MAGQGLNLGLGDALSLSTAVKNGLANGQDIGTRVVLEEYARERYPYDSMVLGAVETVWNLYRGESQAMGYVRGFGTDLIERTGLLKKKIAELVS